MRMTAIVIFAILLQGCALIETYIKKNPQVSICPELVYHAIPDIENVSEVTVIDEEYYALPVTQFELIVDNYGKLIGTIRSYQDQVKIYNEEYHPTQVTQ